MTIEEILDLRQPGRMAEFCKAGPFCGKQCARQHQVRVRNWYDEAASKAVPDGRAGSNPATDTSEAA